MAVVIGDHLYLVLEQQMILEFIISIIAFISKADKLQPFQLAMDLKQGMSLAAARWANIILFKVMSTRLRIPIKLFLSHLSFNLLVRPGDILCANWYWACKAYKVLIYLRDSLRKSLYARHSGIRRT